MQNSSTKEELAAQLDDRSGFVLGDGNCTYEDVVSGKAQERATADSAYIPNAESEE